MSRRSIGFLLHPREGHGERLGAALETAERHDYAIWMATDNPESTFAENAAGCALLVTVGGDGTFLLGARLAAPHGIPVLGVNRGQLGFLTELEVATLPGALDDFAAGRHRVQRRSMLSVRVPGPDAGAPPDLDALALNEVAVKSTGTNLARLRVHADDELLGEYDADGVIVATATGSTAYALSAGGPPVDPRLRALVVVPLAAHAVLTRSIVLPEAVAIYVTVDHGTTICAADGYVQVPLRPGTRIAVCPGPELQVVHVAGSTTFLHRLREKMRIGFPLKQSSPDEPGSD